MGEKKKSFMLPFIINFSSAACYFLPHPLWIFFFYFIYLFRLCWVFIAVRGKDIGLIVVAHRSCCPVACGIFPDKVSNLCPLPTLAGRFLTIGSPVKSPLWILKTHQTNIVILPSTIFLSDYFAPKYRQEFYKFWWILPLITWDALSWFFNLRFGGRALKGGFLSIEPALYTDIHKLLFCYLCIFGKVNVALKIVANLTNETPEQ